jgi:hypothetical protein
LSRTTGGSAALVFTGLLPYEGTAAVESEPEVSSQPARPLAGGPQGQDLVAPPATQVSPSGAVSAGCLGLCLCNAQALQAGASIGSCCSTDDDWIARVVS